MIITGADGEVFEEKAVLLVFISHYLTGLLRIQPWSYDRRDQIKPNREYGRLGEKKEVKQTEGNGQQ